jgi:nucleotide-binding universal stress UspA family protein
VPSQSQPYWWGAAAQCRHSKGRTYNGGVTSPPRFVVPTDFSDTADRALDAAIELARPLGGQLHLIHVYAPVLVLPPPLDMVSLPAVFPDVLQKMEEALEARARRVREAGPGCEVELLEGSPPVEVVACAERVHAAMIVVGTHGRSGLAHAILGSVTERILHRATCPVLVVPDRKP